MLCPRHLRQKRVICSAFESLSMFLRPVWSKGGNALGQWFTLLFIIIKNSATIRFVATIWTPRPIEKRCSERRWNANSLISRTTSDSRSAPSRYYEHCLYNIIFYCMRFSDVTMYLAPRFNTMVSLIRAILYSVMDYWFVGTSTMIVTCKLRLKLFVIYLLFCILYIAYISTFLW